jgi:ZU5 domain
MKKTMTIAKSLRTAMATWVAALAIALGGCSAEHGDSGAPGDPVSGGAAAGDAGPSADAGDGGANGASTGVIGPDGGTVIGPHGARVVIPPGALSTDTLIGVEETSDGAPAFPAGYSGIGSTFAFTPHGTHFAVPVTMVLPFDPASAPDGAAPVLFKTNAQSDWEAVAGAAFGADEVSGQVIGFSYARVVNPSLESLALLPESDGGA